jgi:hypothetical protein
LFWLAGLAAMGKAIKRHTDMNRQILLKHFMVHLL